MKRKAFTMVELMVAILITAVITTLSVMTFSAVSESWTSATEYIDKHQRSDYALNQVVNGLKSMYYPHNGEQDAKYGFILMDNGSGEEPDDSDIIELAKTGHAIVGGLDATADKVHRVQVIVLEEGNDDYRDPIEVTGLYARLCPDPALQPSSDKDGGDTDYSFGNSDMYQPILVVDGIVGMNCRVMESPEEGKEARNDKELFKDEWSKSNSVPYKVELTFWVKDPEAKSYRTNTAPMMRIVRIPIYEQAQDGASLPEDEAKGKGKGGSRRRGGSSR